MLKLLVYGLLTCLIFSQVEGAQKPVTVNLISDKNGRGLEVDQKILKEEIERLGHIANCMYFRDTKTAREFADVNIFFQLVDETYLSYGKKNWLIPNPEWFLQPLEVLESIDMVLCRTHEVERIFSELGVETYYLGFTSRDAYHPKSPKNYNAYLHIAGTSIQKGTLPILEAWRRNPKFPNVTLVQRTVFTPEKSLPNLVWVDSRLSDAEINSLQNRCGIHLCPSETEGFGHCIHEAMSTGGVVVTTDAPPMNEFIKDPRCLLPYDFTANQALATNYYVDSAQVEACVKALMKLSKEELQAIGNANREAFLEQREAFRGNLDRLLKNRRNFRS